MKLPRAICPEEPQPGEANGARSRDLPEGSYRLPLAPNHAIRTTSNPEMFFCLRRLILFSVEKAVLFFSFSIHFRRFICLDFDYKIDPLLLLESN